MSRGVLDEYFEYWCDLTREIVRHDILRCLQNKIDELYNELDPNGTWTEEDLKDTYPVWIEYTKELLRGGYEPAKLKNEVFQYCMHGTM